MSQDHEPRQPDCSNPKSHRSSPQNGPPVVSLGKLFSDSMFYGVAAAFERLLGLILLPVTAAILGITGFGTVGLFLTTSMLVFNLLSLGVPSAIMRDYSQAQSSVHQQRIIVSGLALMFVTGFAGTTVIISLTAVVTRLYGYEDLWPYAALLCGTVFVRLLVAVLITRLQAEGRARFYLIVSVVSAGTSKTLAVGLVLAGLGPIGWIAGELIGLSIQLAILLPMTVMKMSLKPGRIETGQMVRYGIWLVPSNLFFWGIQSVDRYLLWFLLPNPLFAIGLYGAGQRLSSIVSFANFAFKPSWRRFAFSNLNANADSQKLAHAATLYATGLGFIGLSLCLLGDDLIFWLLPTEFHAGSAVLLPLVLAAFCAGLAQICDIGIHQSRSTSTLMWINGLAMLVNVLLGAWLIQAIGFAGAAWATVACQLVKLLLVWRHSQRSVPIPFEYRQLGMVMAIYSHLYLVVQLLQQMTLGNNLYSLLIDGIAILTAPILILLTDAVNKHDRDALSRVLSKLFERALPVHS